MKVLITGGAGFIGSHIADKRLQMGDTVLVIDNFATSRRDNLKEHPHLTLVEKSIADGAVVQQVFETFKPEIVVHAAAAYKDPGNWVEDTLTNVLGTAQVVQAAKEAKVKRFIYFQTALCYGLKPTEQPITLNYPRHSGGSSYAISKTAGELYVELSGLDYVTFRLANAYGPRNISGPLPIFYQRLSTGKSCFVTDTRRDFVFVDDMLECIHKAIEGTGHGVYHLSSGTDFAIKELFDLTTKALKIEAEAQVRPREADDVASLLLDPSRTTQDFKWEVRTSLQEGIQKTIDYYKVYGIEETYTHLKKNTVEAENV